MAQLFLFEDFLSEKPPPEVSNQQQLFPGHHLLRDAVERAQALDITRSWIVEAPAGSGKTGLLIQRYLKLLADDAVDSPEQVLAITFTRKATGEMQERVLAQLQAASNGDKPENGFDRETRPLALAVLDRDRVLGWSLLERPRRLKIRTIDSICSEIAGSLPLLSGSGGHRSPVTDAGPLYAAAARRTFLQLGVTGGDRELDRSLQTLLLHRDGDLAECERLVGVMLAQRDQWGDFVPVGQKRLNDAWLDKTVLPKLERTLDQVICAALRELGRMIPADLLQQLSEAASSMAHLEGLKGEPSPIAVCGGRANTPGLTADDLAHWKALVDLLVTSTSKRWRKRFTRNLVGFEASKADQVRLGNLVARFEENDDLRKTLCNVGELPPAVYPPEQWAVAKALFRVLNRALAELQIIFAERGECDFSEFTLATKTALQSGEGSRDLESALGVHLQHLLVDEMQDTSSSQYDLIETLTQGWDGHSQTVFLVGDPKQSIYLFRQARVERFLRTMSSEHLGDLPLSCLRLASNFRSTSTLVEEFNEDFERLFPSAPDSFHPEEVPFTSASPMRDAGAGSPARIWHTTILPYRKAGHQRNAEKRRQRALDAARIREIVTRWRDRPLPPQRTEPWRIAVLVRSREHLAAIVSAFKDDRSGVPIPFRAVDIEPLKERPEVQDLFALTRALLHPADRVAWLALLHSPTFGFDLADLLTLAGGDDPQWSERSMQQVIAERGHLLESDALTRMELLWPTLEAATAQAGRLPWAELVERTWRSLGGDACCSPSERANAIRYLQLLDEVEEAGTLDLSLLQRRLDSLFAAPLVHSDAVDLLTIHKAKGLEWDVVMVPALERLAGSTRAPLLNWLELDSADEHAAHVLLAPISGRGEDSAALNNWILRVQKERVSAERRRLFYVACTRAREELHLFASPLLSAKGEILRERTSLLEAVWPVVEKHFATAYTDAVPFQAQKRISDIPEEDLLQLAASAGAEGFTESAQVVVLKRLPMDFSPAARTADLRALPYGERDEVPAMQHFRRPEGSVAARAFGNTVHAFLEEAAALAEVQAPVFIRESMAGWSHAISATLRSEGLAPAVIERLTQRVIFALTKTLSDPVGVWLLSAHQGAFTEFALTTWSTRRSSIRIDRILRGGSQPLEPGDGFLWIVDYKTTTHGAEGLEDFLLLERETYAPQLETYAAMIVQEQTLAPDASSIRLALYYPMLARIVWWAPQFSSVS